MASQSLTYGCPISCGRMASSRRPSGSETPAPRVMLKKTFTMRSAAISPAPITKPSGPNGKPPNPRLRRMPRLRLGPPDNLEMDRRSRLFRAYLPDQSAGCAFGCSRAATALRVSGTAVGQPASRRSQKASFAPAKSGLGSPPLSTPSLPVEYSVKPPFGFKW